MQTKMCGSSDAMANMLTLAEPSQTNILYVIGGPCVGKGTHCKRLANDLGIAHVSVGDLLRAETNKPETKNKTIILDSMKAGQLAPNRIVQNVLVEYLIHAKMRGETNFLVDGFPRSPEQAESFEKSVSATEGWTVKGTLHLDCSEQVMQQRMLRRAGAEKRVDDTLEIHKKRVQDFIDQSSPIINFYETRGLCTQVDCKGDFEEVYKELLPLVKSIFDKGDTGK